MYRKLIDIDEKRDHFEIELIKYELELKLLILSICQVIKMISHPKVQDIHFVCCLKGVINSSRRQCNATFNIH
ncbi:unnamed protein product [Rotaria sordida]|uniref:Uncharacterized protein n=1 Tax=Rotaria sordida TaxID=392033 RepID=A0A815A0A7_9BILA|nr:unnamed protein product [Rotaria sordida]CAF1529888.1 unnamed protein product [Rotaria sordida]